MSQASKGRWPANLIHDGSEEVVGLFPDSKSSGGINEGKLGKRIYGHFTNKTIGSNAGGLGDSGSAARFFYCAKASRAEREAGLDDSTADMRNDGRRTDIDNAYQRGKVLRTHHPTVKPLALMRYLCRLVTPPGGIVLDPFMGSGSTGIAAKQEGFGFIGIEKDKDYFSIAEARLKYWGLTTAQLPLIT